MGKFSTNKPKMAEMRANGATYAAIASEYGCTKQAVHSLLNRAAAPKRPYRVHVNTVYPCLHDWLYANSISAQKFAEMMGVSYHTSRKLLRGKTPFTIAQIRTVLKATGMSFDEVFREAVSDAE